MVEILPSILAADLANLQEEVRRVTAAGAGMIHFDVMDGHFVPNHTFGTPVMRSLRKVTEARIDVHLMVTNPDVQVPWFVEAGADCVSVHQEASPNLDRTLRYLQDQGVKAGVVLNPATPAWTLSEVLQVVDFVLVMSVNPGFGAQKFLPHTLEKVAWLATERERRGLDYRIEIDGGMNRETIPLAVRAGVDWVVAGNAVFGAADAGAEFAALAALAREAAAVQA